MCGWPVQHLDTSLWSYAVIIVAVCPSIHPFLYIIQLGRRWAGAYPSCQHTLNRSPVCCRASCSMWFSIVLLWPSLSGRQQMSLKNVLYFLDCYQKRSSMICTESLSEMLAFELNMENTLKALWLPDYQQESQIWSRLLSFCFVLFFSIFCIVLTVVIPFKPLAPQSPSSRHLQD